MPAQVIKLFPRWRSEGREWIYLLGTADGLVKVGKTKDPRSRIATHRSILKNVAWYHIGPCGDATYTYGVERGAICALAAAGQRIRNTETFTGVTKQEALAILRRLGAVNAPRNSADRAIAEAARRAAWAQSQRAMYARLSQSHFRQDGLNGFQVICHDRTVAQPAPKVGEPLPVSSPADRT